MTKYLETLHGFDGLDKDERLYHVIYEHDGELHQSFSVTDDADPDRTIVTALIEGTDYTTDDADTLEIIRADGIGKLGHMMRTDETVRRMLDELVAWIRDAWQREGFEIDDDWNRGYDDGRTSTSMTESDNHHYACGFARGMTTSLAEMAEATPDFIETWMLPYMAFNDPYNRHQLAKDNDSPQRVQLDHMPIDHWDSERGYSHATGWKEKYAGGWWNEYIDPRTGETFLAR